MFFLSSIEDSPGKNSPHVVWSVKNSSWDKSLLAVMCRIFMGLEKRDCKTADKI